MSKVSAATGQHLWHIPCHAPACGSAGIWDSLRCEQGDRPGSRRPCRAGLRLSWGLQKGIGTQHQGTGARGAGDRPRQQGAGR